MAIEFRPVEESNFGAFANLLNKISADDGKLIAQTANEIHEDFAAHNVSAEFDTLAAWDNDELIAGIYTIYLPSTVRQERCYIVGGVDPDRKRQGLGSELMNWALERASAQLAQSRNSLPKYIRTSVLENNSGVGYLMQKFDLTPGQYNNELHRPLSNLPKLQSPSGFKIAAWDVSRNEEARLVKDSAFEDHWGSTPTDSEAWQFITTGTYARQDISYFAINSHNKIVGLVLTHRFPSDDLVLGAKYVVIDKVAVLKDHRGRGVASTLINHALHAYAAEGLDFACLDVDSQSPTGANRLYEKLGFELLRRSVTYEKQL